MEITIKEMKVISGLILALEKIIELTNYPPSPTYNNLIRHKAEMALRDWDNIE